VVVDSTADAAAVSAQCWPMCWRGWRRPRRSRASSGADVRPRGCDAVAASRPRASDLGPVGVGRDARPRPPRASSGAPQRLWRVRAVHAAGRDASGDVAVTRGGPARHPHRAGP
jgi:hypothetical protein